MRIKTTSTSPRARSLGTHTQPHAKWKEAERERDRERDRRALGRRSISGIKMEQRFLRVVGEKDVRAHGNENFDDVGK